MIQQATHYKLLNYHRYYPSISMLWLSYLEGLIISPQATELMLCLRQDYTAIHQHPLQFLLQQLVVTC